MAKRAKRRVRGMFGRKSAGGMWVSGIISEDAAEQFAIAREDLEGLYERTTGDRLKASKAEVIEYLCLGASTARRKMIETR